MSEETQAPAVEESAVEEKPEAVEPKTKGKRKAAIIADVEGYKIYVTTEKHSVSFDIMIRGQVLTGQWSNKSGYVEFAVPNDLVEGFEKHFHFTSGNVVAAD